MPIYNQRLQKNNTDLENLITSIDSLPIVKIEQEKNVIANKNGAVIVEPDAGKVLSKATVDVQVPSDKKPEQTYTKTYTTNGSYPITPDSGKVISGGTITVKTPEPKPEQTKTVTITANGDIPIKPDAGSVLSEVLAKVAVPGSDVSPYTKIEARTWIGDGSNRYRIGHVGKADILMTRVYDSQDDLSSFDVIQASGSTGYPIGNTTFTGAIGAAVSMKTVNDSSLVYTVMNDRPPWVMTIGGDDRSKFPQNVEYIVIIAHR